MIAASTVRPAGAWRGEPVDTILLDFDERHRRRVVMRGTKGTQFLLDLPRAMALRGGDALELADGRLVEIIAAPEPLAEFRAPSARDFARLAWHLGNRHLPAQILDGRIRVRADAIIENMVRGLGFETMHVAAPFDPEAGVRLEPPSRV